jgi:ABC-type Fe3+-hydroxamate transport system substrate-binding protein
MVLRDNRDRVFRTSKRPQRIVSLVPSTTETLAALGCQDRVVGVTRFCCHPKPWVKTIQKIGGTKDVDIERVLALKPDLVLGNCEENTAQIFEALEKHVPVWAPLPKTVPEAITDLRNMGALVHATDRADELAMRCESELALLSAVAREAGTFRYAYLIWRAPWMSISDDTFIASMLAAAGGQNVFADRHERFPTVEVFELQEAAPDVVFLSSEPFPFKAKHRTEVAQTARLSLSQIRFIDGEYASWHGARIADGLAYLRRCRLNGWSTVPITVGDESAD